MKADYINTFLEAATAVIQQVVHVRPSMGELSLQDARFLEGHIWIHIGMKGHMEGDIVFGFQEQVALKVASAMMGGFPLTRMDEIGQSAISELGNMISGNASTILYNKGLVVDITPPRLVQNASEANLSVTRVLSVPLYMEGIGKFDLQVALLK